MTAPWWRHHRRRDVTHGWRHCSASCSGRRRLTRGNVAVWPRSGFAAPSSEWVSLVWHQAHDDITVPSATIRYITMHSPTHFPPGWDTGARHSPSWRCLLHGYIMLHHSVPALKCVITLPVTPCVFCGTSVRCHPLLASQHVPKLQQPHTVLLCCCKPGRL